MAQARDRKQGVAGFGKVGLEFASGLEPRNGLSQMVAEALPAFGGDLVGEVCAAEIPRAVVMVAAGEELTEPGFAAAEFLDAGDEQAASVRVALVEDV